MLGGRTLTRTAVWMTAALLLLGMLGGGCSPLSPEYSLEAYKTATSLKAETLALVGKASQPYSAHAKEVEALNTRIDAAYEFAAGRPLNQIAARQWQILRSPDRNLYGGFVAYWRSHGHVGPAFRDNAKELIGQAFDYIICLEANRQKSTSCAALPGASS